jgi:hypothetical protein
MTLKGFFDCKEEFFIGAFLQFPLFYIIHWWILPVMGITAILWRLGGWEYGNKMFRRIGVPLVVCGTSLLFGVNWMILIAVPFMIWVSPFSYGESSWLFKLTKSDFLTRIVTYAWYWTIFSITYLVIL